MSNKRKIELPSATDIIRNETADFLGVLDSEADPEKEEEIHGTKHAANRNPFSHHLDEKPDYQNSHYYDTSENINKQIAYYKGSGDKENSEDNSDEDDDNEILNSGEDNNDDDETDLDDESDDLDESDDNDDESDDNDDESDDLDESDDNDEESDDLEDESEDLEDESDEENESDDEENDNEKDSENKEGKLGHQKKKNGSVASGSKPAAPAYDEYADGDSSDEEEIRNTIGNVPVEWYDEYDHIGYDTLGKKIFKPDRGDSLDAFLKRMEDPNYKRTVMDRLTGQDVKLVDGDLDLIHRLVKGYVPSAQYNMYEPFLDLYSHEVMETPLSNRPEHKRSFLPSMSDRKKVSRMTHAIKQAAVHKNIRPKRYQVYDLWKSDNIPVPMRRRRNIDYKAPPAKLPTNNQSYNPPPEFLPNAKQLEWINKHKKGHEKQLLLARLPLKYDSLRAVPTHFTYVMDIFNRCLDLYMSSRFAYRKVQGHSKDLLPDLPRPRDLRPYPTKEYSLFKGHRAIVRTLAVHPDGKFLATGSDDHTIKIWEISTVRCILTIDVGDAVQCIAWNPNTKLMMLAAAVGNCAIMINPETYLADKTLITRTNAMLTSPPEDGDYAPTEKVKRTVQWLQPSDSERALGYRAVIKHTHPVKQIVWHQQGDYFATLQPDANTTAVITHQLSRWRSQIPFSRGAVKVSALAFHPKKAYFYICSQGRVRVYSLLDKKLIRLIKTQSASEWISSISIHPNGDHFIIGSYGKKITWYEMECTNRPYTLRYHHGAVRSVDFHPKYPLFASASDDGRVIITHSMVYSDWIKDPLLVPVKELRNHQLFDGLCVLQLAWHPLNPTLFTAGADSTVRLWH